MKSFEQLALEIQEELRELERDGVSLGSEKKLQALQITVS
jgi:hypothetical protein